MGSVSQKPIDGIRGHAVRASIRVMLTCSIVFGLYFLGSSALGYLDQHLFASAPRHELRVGLRTKDVAIVRLTEPGAKTTLRDEDLAAMAGITGVLEVYPVTYADLPSRIELDLMGESFESEMVVQAFEPAWLAGDVDPERLVWEEGRALPVVINTQILTIYNNAYARSRGMPELSAAALEAPLIRLTYGGEKEAGEEIDGETEAPATEVFAKVVGMSPRVALGMAIPKPALEKLHQNLGEPVPDPLEAVLELRADADLDKVRATVEEMGFAILDAHPLAKLVQQIRVMTQTALALLIACLLLFVLALLDQSQANLYLKVRGAGLVPSTGKLVSEVSLWLAAALALAVGIGYGLAVWIGGAWLSPMLAELTGVALTVAIPPLGTPLIAAGILLAAQLSLTVRLWLAR